MESMLPKWADRLWCRIRRRLSRNSRPPVSRATKEQVRACVERGRELYNSRSYTAATEEFRHAVTLDAHDQRALYFLANACYKSNQYKQAMRYWEQCISAEPTTRFASLAQEKIQHVRKQRRSGHDEMQEFFRRMTSR